MIKIMLNHKLEGFQNLRLLGIEEIKNTEGGRNRKEMNVYKKAIELTNTDQNAWINDANRSSRRGSNDIVKSDSLHLFD